MRSPIDGSRIRNHPGTAPTWQPCEGGSRDPLSPRRGEGSGTTPELPVPESGGSVHTCPNPRANASQKCYDAEPSGISAISLFCVGWT